MTPIKALIIDDEEMSCKVLELKLKEYCKNVTVLRSCFSSQQGVESINELQPDVIFLDVQMPNGNGFELLKNFPNPNFKVIFVTAYEEYALKAFKLSATDFLLKPVESSDLVNAVNKVERELSQNTKGDRISLLISTFESLKANQNIKKIALPTLDEIVILDLDDIVYCEGDSNYTNVYLNGGKKLCLSKTLKLFEQFLPEETYFRIHNTHIVNINRIQKITRRDTGYVTMDNGKELAISKSRRDNFYKKINLLK